YIILVLFCFAVSIGFGVYTISSTDPTDTINLLFSRLQDGKAREAESLFADNTCNCPPRGGYGSWLKYESGHEPNLAFLMGHPFITGKPTYKKLEDPQPFSLPWGKPERSEADVALNFSDKYRPIYLPLPLAFGQSIAEADLNTFLSDPL